MTREQNNAPVMNRAGTSSARISTGVRLLTAADLADVLELSRLAGWNQTEADWQRLLRLAPDGCFCMERRDRVIATTTLVPYGTACAWIGMVLTHPDWRHQGFARSLIAHSLALAGRFGIATVKLDATTEGRPLYESLGFTPEQTVERWERPGNSSLTALVGSCSLELDKAAYGYSRADLLQSLAPCADLIVHRDGYVLARPGANRSYIGPCIALNPETASQLLTPVLETSSEVGWFWDLLSGNRNAIALASALGFEPVRKLIRMSVGARLPEQEQNIYALAGFEFG